MKMARCIVELERIYGIKHGNNQQEDRTSNNFKSSITQESLAEQIGVTVQQLHNYKQLLNLVPEIQDLVERDRIKPCLYALLSSLQYTA
jgi:hypothetical protein